MQLQAKLATLEALLEAFNDDSKEPKSAGASRGDGMTAARSLMSVHST